MDRTTEYKFKLELDITYPIPRTVSKYFKTLKTLRQWQKRNDPENLITVLDYREYVLNGKKWERFIIFGTVLVPLSEIISKTNAIFKSEEEKRRI